MELTAEQRKKVKGQGFLSNNDGIHFSARIVTGNGVLTADEMKVVSELARQYGNGQVALTSRMTIELPGIRFDDIPQLQVDLAKAGLATGGTGSKVRPVVSCKGTVCTFGLVDTQGLAQEIHKRFYEGYRHVNLPHKFKIAVGGCPNNCVKPDLNDLGVVGQCKPALQAEACRGCGKCQVAEACPMDAAHVVDGLLEIDADRCNNCGRCIGTCPFHALDEGHTAYKVYVGGRWGKEIRHGTPLQRLFSQEEVLDVIEKAILLFKDRGEAGERFGSLVERMGAAKVEKALLSPSLLRRKEEILAVETEGGATC